MQNGEGWSGINGTLEELTPHAHACLIYGTHDEWRAVVVPFIAIGLRRGEKCIYVADTRTGAELRKYLRAEGVDVAAALKSGQLSLLHETQVYTCTGTFDPDRTIALLRAEAEKAIAEGYPALRGSGEMTWVLHGRPGSDRLLEYESRLNQEVFPHYPLLTICQYDRSRLDAETIQNAILTHPLLISGNQVYHNLYYLPPGALQGAQSVDAQVQQWLDNLEKIRSMYDTLRQKERRLSESQRIAHIGSWEVDLSTGEVAWSEEMYRLYGTSPQAFGHTAAALLELIHPEDRAAMAAWIQALHAEEEPGDLEFRVLLPDGNMRMLCGRGTLERDASGRPVRAIGTAQDITERKQAEEALRKSEERFRGIAENAAVTISIMDLDLRTVYCSPSIVNLTGFTPEEVLGHTPEQDLTPDSLQKAIEAYAEERVLEASGTADPRRSRTLELEEYCKDGSTRWVESTLSYMRDQDGKATGIVAISRDVTERRQAQQQLRESEALLKKAQGIANMGIWVWDIRTNRLECSEQTYRVVGLDKEASTGDAVDALGQMLHPDDRIALEKVVLSARQGKIPAPMELRFLSPNGAVRTAWLEVGELTLDEAGRPAVLTGIIQDITERKVREQQYQTILSTTIDGFWLADMDGRFLDVNQAYCDLVGYSRHELLQMSITDVEAVETRQDIASHIARIRESGHDRFETRHRRKDGSLVDVEVSVNYAPIGTGLMVMFIRDISERKRAERELQHRSDFQQLLATVSARFINVPGGAIDAEIQQAIAQIGEFAEVDRSYVFQFDTTGKLMSNTHEWCAPGIEPQIDNLQNLPTSTFPWWVARLRANQEINIERVANLPPEANAEREILKAQSIQSLIVVPINIQERLIGFLGFDSVRQMHAWPEEDVASLRLMADIVANALERKRNEQERTRLQEQLHQAQKMEAVGRLAGGVAHDFNNMLTAILGYASFALREVGLESPLHEDLLQIQQAAQRSADLTRQLLAFARRQTVAPKVLDLNDAVAGMLKILRRLIGENIDLAWVPGADLWPVKIDPSQIDQILANLAVNARDAITGAGRITIETKNVTLDKAYCARHASSTPGGYVLLAVSDDGCGMDGETLSHIFEPFFTTKGVGEGTGLGLATVYGIVKQNGGFVDVYSEPGKGSTFKIYLPQVVGETEETAIGLAEEMLQGNGETVLLVEDEMVILNLGKAMLQQLGYAVLTASKPSEAIRLSQEYAGKIDLLITDVVMPEMNGRELAERVGAGRPELKCLFMSGYTDNAITHHGVLEEGVHFLQKPFTREDLASKVREALEQGV